MHWNRWNWTPGTIVGDQFTWWTMCLCMCICCECIYRLEQLCHICTLPYWTKTVFVPLDGFSLCLLRWLSRTWNFKQFSYFSVFVQVIVTFSKLWILCRLVFHVVVNVWLVMLFLVGDLFLVPFFSLLSGLLKFSTYFCTVWFLNVRNNLCVCVAIHCVIGCLASLSSR